MRQNDTVKPSVLCLETIHKFKSWHRGIVLARPDRYRCVNVLWQHRPRKPMLMAGRYVEVAEPDGITGAVAQ